jgi:serine/threonine-protein kinase
MLQRDVAIKILHPELLYNEQVKKRFQTEAIMLASLNHPNITSLYNLIKQDDNLMMIMEYVEGQSLEEILNEQRRFSEKESIEIVIQALKGLIHAHERKIIHRDLKLANIMISNEGAVKIMDFGIARVLGSSRMTSEGRVIGTLEYMSPEQIKGEEGDERSDIYALGTVLYEMITGRVPFKSSSDYDLMTTKLSQKPPSIRTFDETNSKHLEKILFHALKRDPQLRYQTARKFQEALVKYLATMKNSNSNLKSRLPYSNIVAVPLAFWSSVRNGFSSISLTLTPKRKGAIWSGLGIFLFCILMFGVAHKVRKKRLAHIPENTELEETLVFDEEDENYSDLSSNSFPNQIINESVQKPIIPVIDNSSEEDDENASKKEPENIEKKRTVEKKKIPVRDKQKPIITESNEKENSTKEAKRKSVPVEAAADKPAEKKESDVQKKSISRKSVHLNAGTPIIIRIDETVSSKQVREGQSVSLSIDRDTRVDGVLILRAGHKLNGKITDAKPSVGSKKGRIELVISRILTDDGHSILLTASTFRVVGKKGEDVFFKKGQTFEVKTAQGMELTGDY